ncbi:dTDP-4-dehydrorhamnose 3,5-epimerase [bacterium]|nr:dTDP-4-dehydrorhamnose 3,5-epimerase [bacterium]
MRFKETEIPGLIIIEPDLFGDERGFFLEVYHSEKFKNAGIEYTFLQDNHSKSRKHVLRGLHYQLKKPQGKLVRVTSGEVFDVGVDIRRGSPTFGKWHGMHLSAENKMQYFVPPGFAHGFVVLSEEAEFLYKCTELYDPTDEYGIKWDDPDLKIDWEVENPVLSEKDMLLPSLKDAVLPVYSA